MSISDQVSMFYNAKPHLFEKAKTLRNNMTPSELILWEKLRSKQILGLKFRPQHPIDIFIADFYCHPLKLVIEIDGSIHLHPEQRQYDIGREAELNQWGIDVIRFTNDEIESHLEQVVRQITTICTLKLSKGQSPL